MANLMLDNDADDNESDAYGNSVLFYQGDDDNEKLGEASGTCRGLDGCM
jgi:hypothetical protein